MAALYSYTEQHPIADWIANPHDLLQQARVNATREAALAGRPGPPDHIRPPGNFTASLYRRRTDQDPLGAPALIPDAANPDIVELRIEWMAGSPTA